MIKTSLMSLAAILSVAPMAAADLREPTEITVEYTDAELQTELGSLTVAERIEREARKACRIDVTGSRIDRVDSDCVGTLVSDAIDAIESKRVAAGKTPAFALAQLITTGQSSEL